MRRQLRPQNDLGLMYQSQAKGELMKEEKKEGASV